MSSDFSVFRWTPFPIWHTYTCVPGERQYVLISSLYVHFIEILYTDNLCREPYNLQNLTSLNSFTDFLFQVKLKESREGTSSSVFDPSEENGRRLRPASQSTLSTGGVWTTFVRRNSDFCVPESSYTSLFGTTQGGWGQIIVI